MASERVGMQSEGNDTRGLPLTAAAERERRRRNLAIGWSLAAFSVLVFFVTLARLGANVLDRPL